jgi:two-component system chemotaxis response regulator CheY
MRALVVDDSRAMRSIIRRHFDELGIHVDEAASGAEALFVLNQIPPPDVVLLDWNMPEMNGLECLRRLRADKDTQNLRVMMVTTESEMAQVALALEAGADEYLMKPFDRQALVEKLLLLGLDPGTDRAA